MKRLTEIGIRTNTDKAYYHKYTEIYEEYFNKFSYNPRILEVGVADYGSIAMYIEFFDNPYILGIDVVDKSNLVNEKWTFKKADQSSLTDLTTCLYDEENFDIIIDDGGHTMKQQQITFGKLIHHVKSGGIYILEDLHTSFHSEYIERDCEFTTFNMLNRITEGDKYFSNYIDSDTQSSIIERIKGIEIFAKNPDDLTDSVTSIITLN